MPYRAIEHTADIGFRVWGGSFAELFESAARAFTGAMVETAPLSSDQTKKRELKAETAEELLVKWLEEILFLFETENFVGLFFEIQQCDGCQLKAVIQGCEWSLEKSALKTQIKAATFHGLAIEKKKGRYAAQIILDV